MGERPGPWKAGLVIVVLAVAGAGLWLVADGPDTGPDDGIGSCIAITEPGRYVLTEDVTDSDADTCLHVRSADVVLEGDGHRVDGVGAFGSAGVLVRSPDGQPLTNVSVRNLQVTDWDDGVRLVGVADGAVTGTTTADNRVGLSLLDVRGSRLADNVARNNQLHGISLLEASANNSLVNNTATGNALFGIHLVAAGTQQNSLVANVASHNEFGVVLVGARANTVSGTVARDNRIAGVWLSAARDNRLAHNRVSNRFYGIFLADGSRGNVLRANHATSNAVGIRLRSSDANRVAANTVSASSDTAILLIASDDTVVVGNVGQRNARGISVVRSTGTRLANNSVSG